MVSYIGMVIYSPVFCSLFLPVLPQRSEVYDVMFELGWNNSCLSIKIEHIF